MTYLAFYRHKQRVRSWRTFKDRFIDDATRLFTRGPYSHCELAILQPDGRYLCYSASIRDNGVRSRLMELPESHWDLIPVTEKSYQISRYFSKTQQKRYDLPGALGLFLPFKQRGNRFFCSEWCWQAIGGEQGWRFSPNQLAKIAKLL
ncbi:MAG: hypothetical protein CR975_02135 [Gammaproteobacteria bacterium]|nr:MAG: hypothetical protein CR975_02135 [Gammaproteobacteria bacterium]